MIHSITLPPRGVFDAWRVAARIAISHRIPPEALDWTGSGGLFAAQALPQEPGGQDVQVPRAFLDLAASVIWHSDPQRFAGLYRTLWRLARGEAEALSHADSLGRRLALMTRAVGRDIHKTHAFVRFHELPSGDSGRRSFAAWFEPDHNTLEPSAPFFADRFADMDWTIATPRLSAHFRGGALTFGPGGARPDLPQDASATLWATYYANIFNPARIKLDAMRSEMPRKYWKNLPETRLIPDLLRDAEARVARMHAAGASAPRPGAAPVSGRYRAGLPCGAATPASLAEAGVAARLCTRCPLCETATQTVWGEGAETARLMIVGEQPGDREDLASRPFIGPAGGVLRAAMTAAQVDPGQVWLTNAVKHFKFTPRGKRRLHQSPDRAEVMKCRWWLDLELEFLRPQVVVALGATAALALTGKAGPLSGLSGRRGRVEPGLHGGPVLVTWHPAHILRLPDAAARNRAEQELTADIGAARDLCG